MQVGATHSYSVTAVDAWGNESPATSSPSVSAPVETTTNIAIADAYVSSTSPNTSYGTANPVRVGTSTSLTTRSYFKFDLTREQPVITSAILRILPTSNTATATVTPHLVGDNTWTEAKNGPTALNWNTAPPLGAAAPGATGFQAGTWKSFDVTSIVTSNSEITIALSEDTPGTAVAMNSREGGDAVAAQLVVTSAPIPDVTAPTTPTNVAATAPTDAESPVSVTWSPSTDDSGLVDHYIVRRNGVSIATAPNPT
jgi:hypothetical protein